jgi:hypothetical protein
LLLKKTSLTLNNEHRFAYDHLFVRHFSKCFRTITIIVHLQIAIWEDWHIPVLARKQAVKPEGNSEIPGSISPLTIDHSQ